MKSVLQGLLNIFSNIVIKLMKAKGQYIFYSYDAMIKQPKGDIYRP